MLFVGKLQCSPCGLLSTLSDAVDFKPSSKIKRQIKENKRGSAKRLYDCSQVMHDTDCKSSMRVKRKKEKRQMSADANK